ncbi:hypothetical protein HYC85_030720 [Camellia sinensis]|uniref:Protein kinase domain-containing protein n=1 Tax=Camellia sinensis TaxID=4442 RepID=A0A7J7G1L2_CAMSI|nr:hypothetical protein HYC85_030720 [Camellia sinensis]
MSIAFETASALAYLHAFDVIHRDAKTNNIFLDNNFCLISSKPAVDITRHRREINLSNMAINKIQNQELHELVDQCLGNDSNMRPSMKEVLEVLKEINSVGYDKKVVDEMDIPADDVVLLKSDPPTLSPNSLRQNWVSRGSTTSNASSS